MALTVEDLVALPLGSLERLSEAASRGSVSAPLDEAQLRAARLEVFSPFVPLLDAFATQAALVTFMRAVVAQRRTLMEVPRAELVWSGPEPINSHARSTAVVLRELFESARSEVFVAGYGFDKGIDLLTPLHSVMRDHGVRARVVLDGSRLKLDLDTPTDEARTRLRQDFLREAWPHLEPIPDLLVDPRSLERVPSHYDAARAFAPISMHAKCVVIDRHWALVGSANFSARAQDRNVEVGVRFADPHFADALLHQWNAAIAAGQIVPL